MNMKQTTYGLILLFVAVSILLSIEIVAAQEQCSTDASVYVRFFLVNNTNNGNLDNQVFVGLNNNSVSDYTLIPLAENGNWIIDSDIQEDVPGISLQRSNGTLYFLFYGYHNQSNPGKETLVADIILKDAVVTSFMNSNESLLNISNIRNQVDGQGDGQYILGNLGQDEVFYTIDGTRVGWYSTVAPLADGFFINVSCESTLDL